MQLYTVRLQQLTMVSRFDSAGKKISDETTAVEVVIRDMPWQTASMYKSKDGTVVIEKQLLSVSEPAFKARGRQTNWNAGATPKRNAKIAPASSTAATAAANAARTGNMSAAINAKVA